VSSTNEKEMLDGKNKVVAPPLLTVAPGSGSGESAGQNLVGGIMVNPASNRRSAARAFVSSIDKSNSGFVIGSCSS